MQRKIDPTILEAALVGYQAELQRIDEKMSAIRKHLGGRVNIAALAPAVSSDGSRPKRQMSAAARKRIAEAQKKRWAEFHAMKKGHALTAKKAAPKRKLSPARRAALAANLAKARAAKAAKKAAA
jgi:hypothetical protein